MRGGFGGADPKICGSRKQGFHRAFPVALCLGGGVFGDVRVISHLNTHHGFIEMPVKDDMSGFVKRYVDCLVIVDCNSPPNCLGQGRGVETMFRASFFNPLEIFVDRPKVA